MQRKWRVTLERRLNQFFEVDGPRVVHIVSGRPQGGPTRQIFTIRRPSYDRLAAAAEPWVALVPSGRTSFTLVRLSSLDWRFYSDVSVQASVDIDAQGKPMGMGERGFREA